mmetsp:Transcript_61796/g.201622  ORF Transcript_61796/g.201622 Transcript_61796/m.201622 type:complete len:282 (-) Transcript_61796:3550-4395(-)
MLSLSPVCESSAFGEPEPGFKHSCRSMASKCRKSAWAFFRVSTRAGCSPWSAWLLRKPPCSNFSFNSSRYLFRTSGIGLPALTTLSTSVLTKATPNLTMSSASLCSASSVASRIQHSATSSEGGFVEAGRRHRRLSSHVLSSWPLPAAKALRLVTSGAMTSSTGSSEATCSNDFIIFFISSRPSAFPLSPSGVAPKLPWLNMLISAVALPSTSFNSSDTCSTSSRPSVKLLRLMRPSSGAGARATSLAKAASFNTSFRFGPKVAESMIARNTAPITGTGSA